MLDRIRVNSCLEDDQFVKGKQHRIYICFGLILFAAHYGLGRDTRPPIHIPK